MRTATVLVCAAVLAGCSGGNGSEGSAYEAEDVVRAFRAAGISLRTKRLDNVDFCSAGRIIGVTITGVDRSGACVYIGPETGREMLPEVVLWNVREKKNWIVWIYPSDEIAEGVVDSPQFFLRQPVRFARVGNVVVAYSRPRDEERIEDALSRI